MIIDDSQTSDRKITISIVPTGFSMFGAAKQTKMQKITSSQGTLWLNQAFWLNQCKQDQTCPGLAVWSRQLKLIVDH